MGVDNSLTEDPALNAAQWKKGIHVANPKSWRKMLRRKFPYACLDQAMKLREVCPLQSQASKQASFSLQVQGYFGVIKTKKIKEHK